MPGLWTSRAAGPAATQPHLLRVETPSSLPRPASAPLLDHAAGLASRRPSRRSTMFKSECLERRAGTFPLKLPPLAMPPPLRSTITSSVNAPAVSQESPQAPRPTLLSRRRGSAEKALRLGFAESCDELSEEAPSKDRAFSKQVAGPSSISSTSTGPPSTMASSSVGGGATAPEKLRMTSPASQFSPARTEWGEVVAERKTRSSVVTKRPTSAGSSACAPCDAASALARTRSATVSKRRVHFAVECSRGSSNSSCSSGSGRSSAERDGGLPSKHCDAVGYHWKCGEQVGSGAFGTVFKALRLDNGQMFAVKKTALPAEENGKVARQNELDICKNLRHRHIVTYFGHEITDDSLYIHMEYLPGGSLSAILKEFGALTSPLLKKATRGMAEGLDYLHSSSPPVVHRDIKAANVLVGKDFCVKLVDFGCSKRSDVTNSLTTVGSIPWMAPEVINQDGGHGRKADIWSFGCVVIEMLTAEKPWGSMAFNNPFAALRHIGMSDSTPPIPSSVHQGARDLAVWCTKRAKSDRPTSAELLMHHFIWERNPTCA